VRSLGHPECRIAADGDVLARLLLMGPAGVKQKTGVSFRPDTKFLLIGERSSPRSTVWLLAL
jgi:hypothetical protein